MGGAAGREPSRFEAMDLDRRQWLTIVLVGLVGQLAWTVENMYGRWRCPTPRR